MNDVPQVSPSNVIPVWGLTPDECTHIVIQADKLMSDGRISGVKEKRRRTYICIFDLEGAPYTIMREQRILHLLDPAGHLLMVGDQLDLILEMLDACLPEVETVVDEAV